jgi:hypothetical protein
MVQLQAREHFEGGGTTLGDLRADARDRLHTTECAARDVICNPAHARKIECRLHANERSEADHEQKSELEFSTEADPFDGDHC